MGLMQLIFGDTKSENHVNSVMSLTNRAVSNTVQECHSKLDMSQILTLSGGCTISNSDLRYRATGLCDISCVQKALSETTLTSEVKSKIAQNAQAVSQGLGLTSAKTRNVVSSSINLANTMVTTIQQVVGQSSSVMQLVNCGEGSTISGSYIDMEAEVGLDGSGAQNATTVLQAKSDLYQEMDQYAKAEAKDVFALLANIGVTAILAVAAVICVIGVAFVATGGIIGRTVSTLLTSSILWCALCAVWITVNTVMYVRKTGLYKREVPLADGTPDTKTRSSNNKLFLALEVSSVAVFGCLVVLSYFMMRARVRSGSFSASAAIATGPVGGRA